MVVFIVIVDINVILIVFVAIVKNNIPIRAITVLFDINDL